MVYCGGGIVLCRILQNTFTQTSLKCFDFYVAAEFEGTMTKTADGCKGKRDDWHCWVSFEVVCCLWACTCFSP